jgi:hypothetical protein
MMARPRVIDWRWLLVLCGLGGKPVGGSRGCARPEDVEAHTKFLVVMPLEALFKKLVSISF